MASKRLKKIPPLHLEPREFEGRSLVSRMFHAMTKSLGYSGWWPAKTHIEVLVGAVLAQNTSWKGASKAVSNLEQEGLLSGKNPIDKLLSMEDRALESLIRPSGYFRQKRRTLKNLLLLVQKEFDSRLEKMANLPLEEIRPKLLSVRGIGPETADSILGDDRETRVFVVDAYTRRIGSRHGLFPEDTSYKQMQDWFMKRLPKDLWIYREFHAQLVRVGARYCRKKPLCAGCPLAGFSVKKLPVD